MESLNMGTLTSGDALALGLGVGMVTGIAILWCVLTIIGDWMIFRKAGKPGWHSIIPILNFYDEYDLCWSGSMGLLFVAASCVSSFISYFTTGPNMFLDIISMVCVVVTFVLHLIESWKLSKAFGKGAGFFIFLLLFDRIARVILGLGKSEYEGRQ